jgi:uncharacterized protein
MAELDIIEKVRKFALNNSLNDDIHGFPHVERVYNTCMKLGEKLNANLLVLKCATLLHDVGRIQESNLKMNHAEMSSNMAGDLLDSAEFHSKISSSLQEEIIHCIRAHSFSNGIKPRSLEAKILSDADKLDALGAIGLYRTIGFTVQNNGGLPEVMEHLENKILKLKDLLYLDVSRHIAQQKHEFILQFYKIMKNDQSEFN